MTRMQMIKALQERGWGKVFAEEKEAAGGKDHRFFSDSRRAWNK